MPTFTRRKGDLNMEKLVKLEMDYDRSKYLYYVKEFKGEGVFLCRAEMNKSGRKKKQ